MLTPHHDGSPLYVSTQTPALGEVVRVRLRVPESFGPLTWVGTRSNPDREPRFSEAVLLPSTGPGSEAGGSASDAGLGSEAGSGSADGADWRWWEASVEVENPVHGYRWLLVREDGRQHWLNQLGLFDTETRDQDDFRLVAHAPAHEWAASSVMYQVFPDRFAKSDDAPFDKLRERDGEPSERGELPEWAIPAEWGDALDPEPPGRSKQLFGGDLDGVRQHLDHLERLGVNLLYLTPVFPARSNHRYDASTFEFVDPLLGGDDALVRLVDAAHARGIRVIGDLTSNHSGDAHEWFRAAQADPDAPERSFYYFRPSTSSATDPGYESWLGVPSLPKFDWSSAELRRRFIDGPDSVVARYLQPPFSLDGWRIDVANMTGRLGDVDLNAEVRQAIRRTMLEVNPDTILLAESTNDAASDFQGDAWHGAMTYTPFTRPVWSWLQEPGSAAGGGIGFAGGRVPTYDGRAFHEAHVRFTAGFPWRTRLATMNALDTHDTPRFATSARPGTVPVAFGLAATLPGIPVVWAGDEFGLTGVDGEASRTPMPWGRETDAAVAPVLDTYASLIAMRRAHPVLATGGIRWLAVDEDAVAFVRESATECVLVFASRGSASASFAAAAVAMGGGRDAATRLHGSARLAASDGVVHLSADGPSFAAWLLPGVDAPVW